MSEANAECDSEEAPSGLEPNVSVMRDEPELYHFERALVNDLLGAKQRLFGQNYFVGRNSKTCLHISLLGIAELFLVPTIVSE